MKERPILFSAPMVRAILSGAKTKTRRVIKPQPDYRYGVLFPQGSSTGYSPDLLAGACPHGRPGDRLWVREAFMHEPADYCWEASVSIPSRPASTVYRADFPQSKPGEGWKPSIHMPRQLSRITLEVTGVRVERLQGISEADAIAEGVLSVQCNDLGTEVPYYRSLFEPRALYRMLWEHIHGPGSWDENPWVWVIEFKKLEQA